MLHQDGMQIMETKDVKNPNRAPSRNEVLQQRKNSKHFNTNLREDHYLNRDLNTDFGAVGQQKTTSELLASNRTSRTASKIVKQASPYMAVKSSSNQRIKALAA